MAGCYIVKFYREVPGGPRRVGQVLLDRVEIRRARDRQRAIEAAILKFKRKRALQRWSGLPTSCRVEPADNQDLPAEMAMPQMARRPTVRSAVRGAGG